MNNDWKPTENNISSPWDVNVQENNIGQPTNWEPTPQTPEQVDEGLRDAFRQSIKDWDALSIKVSKFSNWKCYLFGGDEGFSPITWVPEEGKVPNAWVRFWMKVFFNCKWVKNDD